MNRARWAVVSLVTLALTVGGPVLASGGPAAAQPRAEREQAQRSVPGERVTSPTGRSRVDAKHARRPTVTVRGKRYPAPNPFLAQTLSSTRTDWAYWRHQLAEQGERRAQRRLQRAQRPVPAPSAHPEAEPVGRPGGNDSPTKAERLTGFGVDKPHQAVSVRGSLAQPFAKGKTFTTREDQGSIPRATTLRTTAAVPRAVVSSVIGDGPHGRRGTGTGDFDFYRVTAAAGQSIRATTVGSPLDTVVYVYGAGGAVLAANDDTGDSTHSDLAYRVPRPGTYYVMVAGYSDDEPPLDNPFRVASGNGAGDEGAYKLQVTVRAIDADYYGVELDSGDVLGGTLTGGASRVQVHRLGGAGMVGSEQDASSAYPAQSPLPGGGSTFAYVAEEPGWYAVSAQAGTGAYRLLLEAYPPGASEEPAGSVQTVFLDFDGARLNMNIFFGDGVRTLSPLQAFLTRWGLAAGDLDAVIDATVAGVEENIEETLAARGLNPDLEVRVLNSRDHADPFGRDNVSRVVIGGTIAQSGIPTIGVAQSIDPGNYAHEETAMVLLDEMSGPASSVDSLNRYMKAGSDRVAFVGQALSNVASHEIGHFIGSFHTDNLNSRVDLMDAGGARPEQMYAVGPDRRGGTADDPDVDFGTDVHLPEEGFTGYQDTLNNSAWAFLLGAFAGGGAPQS